MSDDVTYRGFLRTPESGSRRSRTLMLDDGSAQVQAKEATVVTDNKRFLQLRFWTCETEQWTHLIIDPARSGLASIIAVGNGSHEHVSWDAARAAASETAGIDL